MKIGIFWFHQRTILGKAHAFSPAECDSLGLIDSPFTHIATWQTVRSPFPELHHLEYETLPRGRVIFDSSRQKLVVYLDQKLKKKYYAEQIAAFFDANLSDCVFRCDPHYVTSGK